MINNLNISNLQVFDKEGYSLPCSNDLQEAIQTKIATKVGKLLDTEEFIALIPDFDPTEDTKLRLHLTRDGLTIEILDKAQKNTQKNSELTDTVKERKEKIIKKVDSLFKESSALDPFALNSNKIHPIALQPNKDKQIPFKIGFDATLSNPQTQQLRAKIEDLQNQLNKKETTSSEELQIIKDQLQFLTESIRNLSNKQENITYPHTEQYALINKLVDNQQAICQALLALLSRDLNQISNTAPLTPSPAQGIDNLALKELILKLQQEKIDLGSLTAQSYKETSQALEQKEQEIANLQQELKALSGLQLQLSDLQQEKDTLILEQQNLTRQLTQTKEAQLNLSTDYNNKIEELKSSNVSLQKQLSEQITELDKQIKNSDDIHKELEKQLSQLREELVTLKQSKTLIDENHKKASQALEQKEQEIAILYTKLEELSQLPLQLSDLQKEKINLELEYGNLKEQLTQANQNQIKLSATFENEIIKSEKLTENLQTQLSANDKKITQLEVKLQNSLKPEEVQELQNQLSKLQQEKTDLEQTNNLTVRSYEETSQLLEDKNKDLLILQKKLEELSQLPSQLSALQKEKETLELEHRSFTEQLARSKETQTQSATGYTNKIEQLESSKIVLQAQLSAKNEQIIELDKQIKNSDNIHQELEEQLSQLRQELDVLKQSNTLIGKNYKETSQLLECKEQEIAVMQEELKALPELQSHLSVLQKEKEALALEHRNLTEQLTRARETQAQSVTGYTNKIKQLKSSNIVLQTQLSTKDEQITELDKQIKNSDNTHQELEEQLFQLQQELDTLKQSNALIDKDHKETSQLLEGKKQEVITLQEKVEELSQLSPQLSDLQQEKKALALEHGNLTEQLTRARETQTQSVTNYTNKIEQLENLNTALQMQISAKEEQITQLEIKIQNLPKSEELQELQNQISKLQQEKTNLEQTNNLTAQSYKETSQALEQKEQEIATLQQEKETVELEREKFKGQLDQANQNHSAFFEKNQKESNKLNNKITNLQEQLSTKEERITELLQEIKTLPQSKDLEELQIRLSQLEKDKTTLIERCKQLPILEYTISNLEENLVNYEMVDEKAQKSIKEALKAMKGIMQGPLENHSSHENLFASPISREFLNVESMKKEDLKEAVIYLQQQLDDTGAHASREYKRLQSDLQEKEEAIQNLEEAAALYKTLSSKSEEKNTRKIISQFEDHKKEIETLTNINKAFEERLDEKVASEKTLKAQLEQVNKTLKEEEEYRKIIEQEFEEELEKISQDLALEKKTRLEQEKIYGNLIEKLGHEKTEAAEKKAEIMRLLIKDLEQKQPGSCMILLDHLKKYVESGSILKEKEEYILQYILHLIKPAFEHTPEFIRLSSSEEESSGSSDENSSDEYEEDFSLNL